MSKLFNISNNATIDNQAQETEQSNKLGWLKTGLLVAGGAAATIGGVIGARKLYEHFIELDGALDGDDFEEEQEDGSGMGSEEPAENTTDDSSDQDSTSFKEVESEGDPETISTEATDEGTFVENAPEGEDNTEPSEKPVDVVPGTIDPHDGYILPEGKSWKSLVRPAIFDVFRDLESRFNNLDFSDSVYVVRSAASVFERAENMPSITDWEQVWIDSMYKDLDAYVLHAMANIEERHKETQNTDDIILANRLYDEFVNSPMYTFKVGKKLRDILDVITKNPVERDPRTGKSIPTFEAPMLKTYMRNAYMKYSKMDLKFFESADPRYVGQVFYANIGRMHKHSTEDEYEDFSKFENECLVPFSVVSFELYNGLTVNLEVDLRSNPNDKKIINKIYEITEQAHGFYDELMSHYGNDDSYLNTTIETPFDGTSDTVNNIIHSLMSEMDSRCTDLRSEEEQDEGSGEVIAAVAAENETVATTEAPQKMDAEEEFPKPEVADNTAALEKFRKDMDFLNGLLDAVRMSDAQKFFRENLASYINDPNVSEETRNGLAQIQEKITNFLIAEKQAAAIEEANNCSRRSSRKKGGKKNYKKNGRR